jgi:toxin YoeB
VRLVFEDQGWEDYTSWLKTDRKMLARINTLVEDLRRDPFTGIGKPEPLKYHLPGAWSRRIDDEHRLVYIVYRSRDHHPRSSLPLLTSPRVRDN